MASSSFVRFKFILASWVSGLVFDIHWVWRHLLANLRTLCASMYFLAFWGFFLLLWHFSTLLDVCSTFGSTFARCCSTLLDVCLTFARCCSDVARRCSTLLDVCSMFVLVSSRKQAQKHQNGPKNGPKCCARNPPERSSCEIFRRDRRKMRRNFGRNFSQIFVLQFPGKMADKNFRKNPRHFPRCTKLSFSLLQLWGPRGPTKCHRMHEDSQKCTNLRGSAPKPSEYPKQPGNSRKQIQKHQTSQTVRENAPEVDLFDIAFFWLSIFGPFSVFEFWTFHFWY